MWDDSSELFSRPNYVAHFLQRRLSITLRFPRFPVPRFPPLRFGAGFSSSAFSSLAFSATPSLITFYPMKLVHYIKCHIQKIKNKQKFFPILDILFCQNWPKEWKFLDLSRLRNRYNSTQFLTCHQWKQNYQSINIYYVSTSGTQIRDISSTHFTKS